MGKFHLISFVCLILLASTCGAADIYTPDTGDGIFDELLQSINKKFEKNPASRQSRFSEKLSDEFQIPQHSVEELFNIYEFSAADVLLSVSIADVSGQPLKSAAGLYFNHKKDGWKAVFKQLKIEKGSKVYEQIKKDMLIMQ